jgi:hypothetical protein
MMKANELRIGNWVLIPTKDATVKIPVIPFRVLAITLFGELDFSQPTFKESLIVPAKHCDGIPLTEELLIEKCGFKKSGIDQYCHPIFDNTAIYFEIGDDWDFSDANICGDYDGCVHVKIPKELHKLQNIIEDLTGKELEIKL